MARRRPGAGQLPVADHRRHEQGQQVHRDQVPHPIQERETGDSDPLLSRWEDDQEDQDGQQQHHDCVHPCRQAREHKDKTQQIQGQRDYPEEWNRRQIGCNVRGHAEHEAGWDTREGNPAKTTPDRGGVREWESGRVRAHGRAFHFLTVRSHSPTLPLSHSLTLPLSHSLTPTRAPDQKRTPADQAQKQNVAGDPKNGLGRQPQVWLDECRVAEQGEHAAEVARGVQEVRVLGAWVAGFGEPLL